MRNVDVAAAEGERAGERDRKAVVGCLGRKVVG
jgi:hypothetical protein